MAKWGKGDPRWIVEERPDATNVNNWHWTEKNATAWSKSRLSELLEGLEVSNSEATCKVIKVKTCEGEATANNRKAKLIFLYEWDIKLKWEGSLSGFTDKYEGYLDIPNLSDENGPEDIEITVTVKSSEDSAQKLKEFMRKNALEPVRQIAAVYIKELKEEFSKGLILPTKGKQSEVDKQSSSVASMSIRSDVKDQVINCPISKPIPSAPRPDSMTSFTVKEEFKCNAEELFRAFTLPEMVNAFTRGSSYVEPAEGGKFALFNGMVCGRITEMVPPKSLALDWRMQDYPVDHYAKTSLIFHERSDCTELELIQTQVPETKLEKTEDCWKRHYFEAIKFTFGFGARLY